MIKPVSPKHQTDTTQPEESKGEIQAKSECNPQRKRVSNKILIEDEPIIKPKSFIGSSEQLKEKDGRKGANFKVDGAPVKSNEEDSKKASPTLKN